MSSSSLLVDECFLFLCFFFFFFFGVCLIFSMMSSSSLLVDECFLFLCFFFFFFFGVFEATSLGISPMSGCCSTRCWLLMLDDPMTFMGSWTLSSPGGGGWSLLTTRGDGERPGGLSNEEVALSFGEIIFKF